MKIKTFKVEQWMNEYENDAVYNLAETCVDSLTLRELLILAEKNPEEFMKGLADTRMTYSHIYGSDAYRNGISGLYEKIEPHQVIPTHGAIGGNHLALLSILERGDSMVSVMPTYQQHYSIPESIGAEVNILQLTPEKGFLPDLKELKRMVKGNTKLITINNPNNPSGSLIPQEMLEEIVYIASKAGAYILSDEVYRGLSIDESYMPSITDLYEKGISVGSMSKVFSLAGLRMGWIAARCQEVLDLCKERRDYDTISCGVMDDIFASVALESKEAIFKRNREIIKKNRKILDDWVNAEPHITYTKPEAGTTALLYYDFKVPSREFCKNLLKDTGVFFTPGECFELEYCVRIGYAYDSKTLAEGLKKLSEYMKQVYKEG
ncbi:aminotransferase [Sinanaerobacter sp. ZZT-01]|uniref:aminotransferase n=1 Tax=Sinanaerobacter sp. ZZT-01 TaxID=3111540 RepID=UPI002D76EF37|nr:aminotransferase [Sinanaerobacter sp. ZZT-01]WRR93621.1 aminotransferase [Sinanaerobacter sp. ZZT-01]